MPVTERVLEAEDRYVFFLDAMPKDTAEWSASERLDAAEMEDNLRHLYDLDGISASERMLKPLS